MALAEWQREQIKLRATYLNNLAVSIFAAGVLTPVITIALRMQADGNLMTFAVLTAFVCFPLSLVLHLRAFEHLRELDQ